MDRTTGDGGRSLTSCRKATAVLADGSPCNFADVAQLAEHGHAMAEATSSKLVIRSTSGVSMHSAAASHGVDGPGCARPWPSHVQRDTHVRRDARVWAQPKWTQPPDTSCSSRRPRTPGFQSGDAGFAQRAQRVGRAAGAGRRPSAKREQSRTRRQNMKPSSSSRFGGGNRPRRLGGAGTRDRLDFASLTQRPECRPV
jgi:hypothetical protein